MITETEYLLLGGGLRPETATLILMGGGGGVCQDWVGRSIDTPPPTPPDMLPPITLNW